MATSKATTCKICGGPRANTGLVLCEAHLREYWRHAADKKAAKKAGRPAPRALSAKQRVRVTVTGDRVTMDLATFQRLMKRQRPQPPALPPPTGQRLAVVSADLSRVLLVEATAGQVQEIDESQYAEQLMTLREAGYAVCVEG